MQTKRLSVLTEGGKVFGFGHITRCLSIVKYFDKYGVSIEFIVDGDDSILLMLKDYSFVLIDWLNDKSVLQKIKKSTFILIDSLRVTDGHIQEIQKLGANVIYIDDDKRHNFLDKGFVLDWTILSDNKNYFLPKKKGVTYLLGSKYTPLRVEFKNIEKVSTSKQIQNILVSFGGSDVRNLTPTVLATLNKNFPYLKKYIVIGTGFINNDSIKLHQDKNTTLVYNADAKKMASLMQESDIAISSGGQTLYELAYLGLPTIAILLVENAREDTEGWAEVGFIDYIGGFDDIDLMKKLATSVELLKDQKIRQKMQFNAAKFIDFNGGSLIVDAIMKGSV
jgi:UDP-2,4-diacetamido-2,4,6-trideoxy-beta-L-altropyranose hydrolase